MAYSNLFPRVWSGNWSEQLCTCVLVPDESCSPGIVSDGAGTSSKYEVSSSRARSSPRASNSEEKLV